MRNKPSLNLDVNGNVPRARELRLLRVFLGVRLW